MRLSRWELALWCACSAYFGALIGTIAFLDADVAKWLGVCSAGLAVAVAVGGYLINARSLQLQVKTEDNKQFERQWHAFGRGQVVCIDITAAIDNTRRLLKRFEDGEALTRAHLSLLEYDGMNVRVEDDPVTFRLVETIWQGVRKWSAAGRNPALGAYPFTETEAETLRLAITQMTNAREHVRTQYLDVLLPLIEQRGITTALDENGNYRITGMRRQD